MNENHLTHLNAAGEANMVDVSAKAVSTRTARAQAVVLMETNTATQLQTASLKKGDILAVARIAGIMAAKRTPDLIPLCHSLPLSSVDVSFEMQIDAPQARLVIHTTCVTNAQTGVEMEALSAASVAALTIYDMCKAIDKHIVITDVMLLAKQGGASGDFTRAQPKNC